MRLVRRFNFTLKEGEKMWTDEFFQKCEKMTVALDIMADIATERQPGHYGLHRYIVDFFDYLAIAREFKASEYKDISLFGHKFEGLYRVMQETDDVFKKYPPTSRTARKQLSKQVKTFESATKIVERFGKQWIKDVI